MTTFTGTGVLLRFSLRRDRVLIPVWLAVNGLISSPCGAAGGRRAGGLRRRNLPT